MRVTLSDGGGGRRRGSWAQCGRQLCSLLAGHGQSVSDAGAGCSLRPARRPHGDAANATRRSLPPSAPTHCPARRTTPHAGTHGRERGHRSPRTPQQATNSQRASAMTRRLPLLPALLLLVVCLAVPVRAGSVIAPPWVNVTLNPCSTESWQLVRWPEDGRCYAIFQQGPCPHTQELVWHGVRGRAVCACPSGHLLHGPTARCYQRHTRGPCPRRHFLAEAPDSSDGGRATCRPFGECAPGEIFWPADGACHLHLTRGPCARGELLALNRLTLEPECGCSRQHMTRSYWPHTDSCYQEYTRGPCPDGLLFVYNASRESVECSCHERMREHYDPATGMCFAQNERGPCAQGNLFVYDSVLRRPECRCEPGGLREPITGACYRAYTQGPCAAGQLVAPAPGAPHQAVCVENQCRRGELLFPVEGVCYRIGARGPCPAGQLVRYEPYRGVSYRGACGCSERLRQNYWPADGRCYQQRTRGPCPPRHVFDFNTSTGRTECRCERRRGRAVAGGRCGVQLQDIRPRTAAEGRAPPVPRAPLEALELIRITR